jgi:hypothetical protein
MALVEVNDEQSARVMNAANDWAQTMVFEHTRDQDRSNERAIVLMMGSCRLVVAFAKMLGIEEQAVFDTLRKMFAKTAVEKRTIPNA